MADDRADAARPAKRTVAVVPHTHWDREWYLPFQSFRLRLVELLDDLLPHLEADPGYAHFLLDGQLAVVDDYVAVRPGGDEAIARLVAAGRLSLGPWYTLPDEFLVSGETLVRNLQLGLDRARRLGGAMRVGYLPDMFGHVAQMPQLLRLFGIDDAVVWRGVPAAIERTAFRWVAPDGSAVRAEYLAAGYGNGARVPHDAHGLVERIEEFADRYDAMLAGGPVLWMNGTDHLLPQPWLSDVVAKANASQDTWELAVVALEHYLASIATPLDDESPAWHGELRSGARANLLMGVTSNRVDVRAAAARAERALERLAEPACALFLPRAEWPDSLLAEAWLGLVRNAAHDSVCACSDDEVVDAVLVRYAEARQIGEGLADRAVARLGGAVAADGPVVVNLSPRARSGLVELVLPGEVAPPGVQVLRARSRLVALGEFASASMAAGIVAELEYLPRYLSARIVDVETGDERFATVRASGGQLVSPADRGALEALMDETSARPQRVEVTQEPGHKVLARVEGVPGFGWAAWDPMASEASAVAVSAVESTGGTALGNGLVTVDAGAIRYVDGGDVGDTYNWCPADGDEPAALELVSASVTEEGALRGRFTLRHEAGDDLRIQTVVEVRAGERLIRVETAIDNRRRDHRLRAHLALPQPTTASEAECAFAIVTRGLTAEGGPSEVGLPTFPARRFVRAGGLIVVHEGVSEYELVDVGSDAAAREIALTMLRCTGMLSQVPMATRPLPAGPFQPLEGSQLQGRIVRRWGFVADDDGTVDPYALVDDAFLPLRATTGGGAGATLPAAGSALTVSGAEVSAVRRTAGEHVEVRLFNPTGGDVVALLPGRRGWVVDLRGRPEHPFEERLDLRPWQIATLHLDPSSELGPGTASE
jgi:2-O-(6-phospho-alpha-D-mannosyl)-D-glycerate hydrolase